MVRRVFTVSENDILRKHIKLLRKAEFHINTKHMFRSAFYRTKLLRLQNKY